MKQVRRISKKEFDEISSLKKERQKLEKEIEKHNKIVEEFGKYKTSVISELNSELNKLEAEKSIVAHLKQQYESRIDLIGDFTHEQKRINERVCKAINTTRVVVGYHRNEERMDSTTTSLILNNWKTVDALSEISNLRMELFEFCVAPNLFENTGFELIKPYPLFEKIYKSINSGFDSEARKFVLKGQSYGYFRAKRILPISFFILLDNAWKYTIPDREIIIDFEEIGNNLKVRVINWGPWIDDDELNQLTIRGYRGKYAKLSHCDSGKGLGLYIVKQILDICGVKYSFTRMPCKPEIIKDIKYGLFCVELNFSPIRIDKIT